MYPHYQPMGYQSMSGTAMTSGGSLQIPGYAWQQGPANQPLWDSTQFGVPLSHHSMSHSLPVSSNVPLAQMQPVQPAITAMAAPMGCNPFPMPVSGSMYSCAPTSQTSAASGSVLTQPAASQTPVATEQQPGSQPSDRRRREKSLSQSHHRKRRRTSKGRARRRSSSPKRHATRRRRSSPRRGRRNHSSPRRGRRNQTRRGRSRSRTPPEKTQAASGRLNHERRLGKAQDQPVIGQGGSQQVRRQQNWSHWPDQQTRWPHQRSWLASNPSWQSHRQDWQQGKWNQQSQWRDQRKPLNKPKVQLAKQQPKPPTGSGLPGPRTTGNKGAKEQDTAAASQAKYPEWQPVIQRAMSDPNRVLIPRELSEPQAALAVDQEAQDEWAKALQAKDKELIEQHAFDLARCILAFDPELRPTPGLIVHHAQEDETRAFVGVIWPEPEKKVAGWTDGLEENSGPTTTTITWCHGTTVKAGVLALQEKLLRPQTWLPGDFPSYGFYAVAVVKSWDVTAVTEVAKKCSLIGKGHQGCLLVGDFQTVRGHTKLEAGSTWDDQLAVAKTFCCRRDSK